MAQSLALRSFQEGSKAFASLLNYDALVAEGVMLNQDGSLTGCFYYAGPDLDSLPPEECSALSAYVNEVLCWFGTGWTINVDVLRVPAIDYPDTREFPDLLSYLIDEERRQHYKAQEGHFETSYVLTLTWLPEQSSRKFSDKALSRVRRAFQNRRDDKDDTTPYDLPGLIEKFTMTLGNIEQALSARLTVQRMNSQDMLIFFHQCITGKSISLRVPEMPWMLNHYIGAYDFIGGIEPRIDGRHIGCVAIADFPASSYTGITAELASLPFEYRYSTRFIILDQQEALKEIRKLRDSLHNKQFDIMSLIGLAFNTTVGQSSYRNEEAIQKAGDAAEAMNEARDGTVKYGYYTAVIVVHDDNLESLQSKLQYIKKLMDNRGFAVRIEEMNSVEAYLGSLPAHIYPNLRRPLLHTLNLAHLVPLSSIWAGDEHCSNPRMPAGSAPLFFAKTTGFTPFRFDMYVGDVGHTAIFGPTGAGKSVLLGLFAAQYLRYPEAQVFVFEKGRSQYALATACGADYYDIQGDSAIAFCPLAHIDKPQEQSWACEWMEELLILQGMTIDSEKRNLIAHALTTLASSKNRTLSNFVHAVQDKHPQNRNFPRDANMT